jgi:hypothetical protein
MTLQLLHSEFPHIHIWGKFDFLFYQCILCCIYTKVVGLQPTETVRRWLSLICQLEPFGRDGNGPADKWSAQNILRGCSNLSCIHMYTEQKSTCCMFFLVSYVMEVCHCSLVNTVYIHCTTVHANLLYYRISLTKILYIRFGARYATVDLAHFKRKTKRCAPPPPHPRPCIYNWLPWY